MTAVTVGTDAAIAAARSTARAIGDLPASFMLDAATYTAAAEAGYEGMAFYVSGRGGVLGDVDAAAVTDAFVFFPAGTVETGWHTGASVEPRADSARRWSAVASRWAAEHLPEGALDYARLAELAGIVSDAADPTGAPVFAGWRQLPEPDGERELALHRLNSLRELRAARHGEAVLAAGIEPVEALMVKTPYMADIFGWPEPRPDPDEALRDRWQAAEDETDRRFAGDLAVLNAEQLAEFAELAEAARRAAT